MSAFNKKAAGASSFVGNYVYHIDDIFLRLNKNNKSTLNEVYRKVFEASTMSMMEERPRTSTAKSLDEVMMNKPETFKRIIVTRNNSTDKLPQGDLDLGNLHDRKNEAFGEKLGSYFYEKNYFCRTRFFRKTNALIINFAKFGFLSVEFLF
jgi:hypothetical protein